MRLRKLLIVLLAMVMLAGALSLAPAAHAEEDPTGGWRTIFIGGGMNSLLDYPELYPIEHGVVTVRNVTRDSSVTSSRTTRVTAAAHEGDELEVTVVPDEGYTLSWTRFIGFDVNDEYSSIHYIDLTVTNHGNGVYSFTMPVHYLYVVQINPVFNAVPKYTVAIADTENGSVTADKETAREGEVVTLTVTPDENCELESLTVTKASGGTVKVTDNQFTMPSEDVTVSAVFTRSYTVTYKVVNGTWEDGTTADVSETVAEGGSPADVPTGMVADSGFTGGSWDADPTSATITADATFTYTFEAEDVTPPGPATYTVTFDANGHGTAPEAQQVEEGATATEPEAPTAGGWEFGGWYTDEACTEAFDFGTAIKADATIYDKWTEETETQPEPEQTGECTITFDLNGGTLDGRSGSIEVRAKVGDVIVVPPAPTREGYAFDYWKGSEYHPGDRYVVEGDHTFTAQWVRAASPALPRTGDPSPAAAAATLALAGGGAALCGALLRRREGR